MSYADGIDPDLAQRVFQARIDADYNFASDLPEQLDRVHGRLTLRLGNDNEDSIQDVIDDPRAPAWSPTGVARPP